MTVDYLNDNKRLVTKWACIIHLFSNLRFLETDNRDFLIILCKYCEWYDKILNLDGLGDELEKINRDIKIDSLDKVFEIFHKDFNKLVNLQAYRNYQIDRLWQK